MDEMRDRRYLLLIPFAALLAVLPLVLKGSSCGHDFEFHIINWLEVGSQWKQGVLLPRWDFTAAWNSGEPRFVFYPPLSWSIGALLGLVLPWAIVSGVFLWLTLTACGFTMYRLAREWTGEGNASIAACFYIVHPYMLFTLFERSAYAELLAAAWVPLLLLSILRPRLTIRGIALPVTLLWLTNDPAAVMGCYTLAVLGILRIAWTWRTSKNSRKAMRDAATIAIGTCMGLALAGFYLVPAIVERAWVQITMTGVEGVRYQDNFLFGKIGSPSHQAILRTASLSSIALLLLIALFAIIAIYGRVSQPQDPEAPYRRAAVALLLTSLVIGFLLTAASAVLWRHAPELKYLQFPWRFNTILGAAAAALLALTLRRVTPRYSVAIAIALAIPLLSAVGGYHLFHQYCNRGNDVASLVDDFNRGSHYDSTDEYTPAGADHFALEHANPAAWIAGTPIAPAPADTPKNYSVALAKRLHFDVSSPTPGFFVISLRDYRAWKIAINGVPSTSYPHRVDGLIVLPVSAGRSTIDITYTRTWDQVAGWIVTALALCVLFAIWRRDGLHTAKL